MKFLLALLSLFIINSKVHSQPVYVPYRVNDKFGIADELGRIIIKPQFNIIEPMNEKLLFFKAYIFNNNEVLSSLIYNNKIIISNQKYKSYYFYNDLIVAIGYQVNDPQHTNRKAGYEEKQHLYNLEGKSIFNDDFKDVNVYTEIDEKNTLNEVLISSTDNNNYFSLYVYDKKLKKITKTCCSDVQLVDVDFDDIQDNNKISFIFKDAGGQGKKLTLQVINKIIKTITEEPVALNKKSSDDNFTDDNVAIQPAYDEAIKTIDKSDSIILKINSVNVKGGFYFLPKKEEEIYFKTENVDKSYCYIVVKNGKEGLKITEKNTLLIPIKYDEIYKAESSGPYGGYVLADNNKYGLFIYKFPDNIVIEPVFDKIPLLGEMDYVREKFHLIKLYDKNGKFFCYANHDGKLYYSEN